VADLNSSYTSNGNQAQDGGQSADADNADNLSPWEVDLDMPEENPPQEPIVGTFYDTATTPQSAAPASPQLNVPQQSLDNVSPTIPGETLVGNSSQQIASTVSQPTQSIAPPPNPTASAPISANSDIIATQPVAGLGTNNQAPVNQAMYQTPDPGTQPVSQSTISAAPQLQDIPVIEQGGKSTPEISTNPFLDIFHNIMKAKQVIFIVIGFLIIIIGMIIFTETGNLSIGVEKVYGALGLESVWGGLPKDASKAFYESFSKLSSEQTFKMRGTISLTVNKSEHSPTLSPIIGQYGFPHFASDENVGGESIKAIKAESATDYDYILDGTPDQTLDFDSADTNSATSTDTSSPVTTNTANTNSNSDSDGTPSTFYDDQLNYPSYEVQAPSNTDVYADIEGAFSPSGIEALLKIKKPVGTADITLKNATGKLWVKSDKDIKFASNADPEKWLEYNLPALDKNSIQSSLFSPMALSGVTIAGSRVGNVPMGNVRCYQYHIENFTPGNILNNFGIKTDQIKNISGDIWIGINDKLPRRLTLKLTGANNTPLQSMDLSLNLYDYGVQNNFSEPIAEERVVPAKAVENTNTNSSVPVATVTGDNRRISDLASIKEALDKYKLEKGSYPTAKTLVRLNISDNQISALLIPTYISELPTDPKDADGWFYGYKSSDGNSFTLSAKLEDATNSQAVIQDGVPIYKLEVSASSTPVATTNSANDQTRKADLAQIKDALIRYYNDNYEYPISKQILKIGETNALKTALVPGYLDVLPVDPTTGWYYGYKSPDGQSFSLSARLENTKDAEAKLSGGIYLYFLYNE